MQTAGKKVITWVLGLTLHRVYTIEFIHGGNFSAGCFMVLYNYMIGANNI